MNRYAREKNQGIISAFEAKSGINYSCIECFGPLRKREGAKVQPHFFHLKGALGCRQGGKSAAHLHVQQKIIDALPLGEGKIERHFPEIDRIADVCWEEKKLVFEVQCSPITGKEVAARNRDYLSSGFQPIWIFHTKRFGRGYLSSAEKVVADSPHYYTDIDAKGEGEIFDQWVQSVDRYQRAPLPLLPIKVFGYRFISPSSLSPIRAKWPLCFEGDLLYGLLTQAEYVKPFTVFLEEVKKNPKKKNILSVLWSFIDISYRRAIFRLIDTI